MLTIYREGLTIIANEPLEPSEGSYNVPVQLIEVGEDTYSGSITMYIGWYQKGIIKKRSIVADEPGKFRIPAIAFQQNGPLFISFLLENEDKTEGLMTNTLTYIVKDAPYTIIDPTSDPTWQEQIKGWIEGLVDSTLTKAGAAAEAKTVGDRFNEFSKRIDSLGGGVTSWNDLTDKPFYSDGVSLTYNGDYENYEKVGIAYDNSTVYFVKVSDEIINYEDVLNGTVTIVEQAEEMSMSIDETLIMQDESGLLIADSINVVTVDSYEIDGATLTRGIWFAHMLIGNESMMYVKALDCGTIKKLDMKYIDTDAIKDIVNDVITEALNSEV